MQVHCDDVVATRNSQHVRHKLRRDGSPGFVLFVHASVREARNNSRNAPRGSGSARRDKNKEFHEIIIDVATPRLDDEYIFVSDGLGDLDVGLAVGELFDGTRDKGYIEPRICEQITSLWTVSMAATHGEAAHRSVTAWASSGWLFPERGS